MQSRARRGGEHREFTLFWGAGEGVVIVEGDRRFREAAPPVGYTRGQTNRWTPEGLNIGSPKSYIVITSMAEDRTPFVLRRTT